jgi:hypothetical protein
MRSSPRQIILEALAATLPDLDSSRLGRAADEIALRLSRCLQEEDRPNLRGAISSGSPGCLSWNWISVSPLDD